MPSGKRRDDLIQTGRGVKGGKGGEVLKALHPDFARLHRGSRVVHPIERLHHCGWVLGEDDFCVRPVPLCDFSLPVPYLNGPNADAGKVIDDVHVCLGSQLDIYK